MRVLDYENALVLLNEIKDNSEVIILLKSKCLFGLNKF